MLAVSPNLASFRPNTFGAELARLRGDVHLSQRALARLAGVSNTAISELESGGAPAPHPSMLSKLARGLATSGSQKVDEARAEAAYLALMRAAGYVPPNETPAVPAVPADIEAAVRALIPATEVELLADTLRGLARHDERRQRYLIRTFALQVSEIPTLDE
jgi:transcriptional regulator with XRE-family HTH domain